MYHFCGSLYVWHVACGHMVVVSDKLLVGTRVWYGVHGGLGGRSLKVNAVGFFFRRVLRRALFLSE